MNITPDLLIAAVGCTRANAERFAPHLAEGCAHYRIDTPERLAAFLAQLGHESGSFAYVREIADGSAYEGRRDLGNTEPGDGRRYPGRGLIQLTGKSNHAAVSRWLAWAGAPDFVAQPEKLEEPRWAALSACAYWAENGLNPLADRGEYVAIGRAINRGSMYDTRQANGEADRLQRWERAKAAMSKIAQEVDTSPEPVQQTPKTEHIPAGEAGDYRPEAPMAVPALAVIAKTFLGGLAAGLIDAFTPLAKEKVAKELSRHGADSAAATQIVGAVVDAAKAATGNADPVAAVADAKGNPAVVATVERDTLATLDRLAPMLDKLEEHGRQAHADTEQSRRDAHERAQAEPFDMARWLMIGAFVVVGLLILLIAGVVVFQIHKAGKADPEVWALLVALVTWATAKLGSIFDYRFGTSRSSATKDVVIGELSRRKP